MSESRARALSQLLLHTVYRNAPELEVAELIDAGAPVNDVTEYGESPLRVASDNGRFRVARLLLDAGADDDRPSWTPTFHAVAVR